MTGVRLKAARRDAACVSGRLGRYVGGEQWLGSLLTAIFGFVSAWLSSVRLRQK